MALFVYFIHHLRFFLSDTCQTSMPRWSCAFTHCHNNWYRIHKWRNTICAIHGEDHGGGKCICPPPFAPFKFPIDADARKIWESAVYRMDPTSKNNWQSNSNSRICSIHFKDGQPTTIHSYPTENLPPKNYYQRSAPKPRSDRKRLSEGACDDPPKSKCSQNTQLEPNNASISQSKSPEQFSYVPSFHSYCLEPPIESKDVSQMDTTKVDTDEFVDVPADYCGSCTSKDIKIRSLLSLIGRLKKEVRLLNQNLDSKNRKPFGAENIQKDDSTMIFYTGIPTVAAFNGLYNHLQPKVARIKLWKGSRTVSHRLRNFNA